MARYVQFDSGMKITRPEEHPIVPYLARTVPAQPRNGYDVAGFGLLVGAAVCFGVGAAVHARRGRR